MSGILFKAKPIPWTAKKDDFYGDCFRIDDIARERMELKERDEYLAKELQAFYKLNQGYSLMGVNSILMKVIKELMK